MDLNLGRREILSILFKNWKMLLFAFLAVFAVFFGGSYILTSRYKAESQVLVQSGREFEVVPDKGDGSPAGVPYMTKQEVINSEVEILVSRDLAADVIKAMGLRRIYPSIADDGDPEAVQMNAAIKKFTKSFKAQPVTMSNIITIQFWHPDRATAIATLQKLAEVYEQRHAEIFGDKRSGILNEQAEGYQKQLAAITQKITDLKNSKHLSDINYEREQLIQDRSDVEAKLRDLKAQSIEAHRSLDFYAQKLKTMPELVLSNENSADAIETAKSRLLDLNTQLLQLKQRYSEQNVDAAGPRQDLENQIAQIKAFIADPTVNQQKSLTRNITYDDGRMKLQAAEAAVPAVDQKMAFEAAEDNRILARLQALDEGESSLEIMTREQATLRELVHDYRNRYEQAHSEGGMDKQNMISVSLIHPPESDQKPDKPNHLLYGAVGFVAGLLFVTGLLLYLLIFREAIITPESLQRTLNIRVLGAVPDAA
jgi:uncharacterized protein involved in exopolysaccharide biosynthesis